MSKGKENTSLESDFGGQGDQGIMFSQEVSFSMINRIANGVVNFFAKLGVDSVHGGAFPLLGS